MFRKLRACLNGQNRARQWPMRTVMMMSALAIAWLMTTPAESGKPSGKKGGKPGGGGIVRLCVTIDDQLLPGDPGIYSDLFGSYCDGIDHVEAITGGGFRLDTAANTSTSHPPVRFVTLNFSSEVFPDPDEPGTHLAPRWFDTNGTPVPEGLATTDTRFHVEYYSDGSGNLTLADGSPVPDESFRQVSNSRMDPTLMLPGEIARAALNVPFRTFEADGSVRQWRVVYGDHPAMPSMPYAVPVWVTASQSQLSTGEPEYWTIDGTRAAVFELVPGKKKNRVVTVFTGYFDLPIGMKLERL